MSEGNGNTALRATPRELAEAVAAIEARRVTIQTHEAEMVEVHSAVEQLGLDINAEEVAKEISSRRIEQAAQEQERRLQSAHSQQRRNSLRTFFIIFTSPILVLCVIFLWRMIMIRPSPPVNVAAPPKATMPAPSLKPLATYPAGEIVYVDWETLREYASGVSPQKIIVDDSIQRTGGLHIGNLPVMWQLSFNSEAGAFVRAWVKRETVLDFANRRPVFVANAPGEGFDTPITVPLRRFASPPGGYRSTSEDDRTYIIGIQLASGGD